MIKVWFNIVGIILVFLNASFVPSEADHPIHLSLCEMHHNKQTGRLEVSLKIFTDDLEEALFMKGYKNLYIGTENEKVGAEKLIFSYILDRFVFTLGGEQVAFEWVGKENSRDLMATWCYFESQPMHALASLQFRNCILMELFGDQKNIVHYYPAEKEKKHYLFTQRQCRN